MTTETIAVKELRHHIERIEALKAEIADLNGDLKDQMLVAKGQGFDPKTLRTIIKLRAMDPTARAEAQALLDTYRAALGMGD